MNKADIEPMIAKGMTIAKIAAHFGLTNTPMRRWLKLFNLKTERQRVFRRTSWTDSELTEAVRISATKADVLRRFGLPIRSGNYDTLNRHVMRLGLSTKHLKGKSHGRSGQKLQRPLSEVLVKNSTYSRKSLKQRLIDNKMLTEQCSECGLRQTWNGKPIKLILDHKNGIFNDHRLSNLRLLCPNCNSQTPTFCRGHCK